MIQTIRNKTIVVISTVFMVVLISSYIFYTTETYFMILVSVLVGLVVIMGWINRVLNKLDQKLDQLSETMSKAAHGHLPDKAYDEGIFASLEHQFYLLFSRLEDQKQQNINEKEKMSELITELSHQIKTPVSSIKLFNELLIEENDSEMLQKMKSEVNRLEWLSKVLLDISKLETGLIQYTPKTVAIQTIMTEVINNLYSKASSNNIEIIGDFKSNFEVEVDEKWTVEAFINIIDNAIKYSKPNSKIEVSTVSNSITNRVIIKDTGIGIPKKDIPYIYNRFYKGENTRTEEGTGIGLYLASEIFSMSNTSIKVKSELNQGTTFEIIFY